MDAVEDFIAFGLSTRYEDLPGAVIERTRLGLLDTLAAAIAGIGGEGISGLTDLAMQWGGAPQATLITNGARLPAHVAGLINGSAARAWDLDDVHEQNTCHVFATIVPAALSIAEARGPVSGKELITAMAVGAEMICRLSSAPRLSFSETGSSLTYQCGIYGAALTAARILGLDADRTRHALGIAHAKVAGNQQGFLAGAMTVRLMQGVTAEGGLLSALLAECGITGSSEILEGKFGYFPVYQRGAYDRDCLLDRLGEKWLVPEISIKPAAPCCKYTHAPVAATILAMRNLDIEPGRIDKIVVRVTNREVYDLTCLPADRKWRPRTVVDAQFSLPFTVAHAALHGKVDLGSFQPDGLADEGVRALMRSVSAVFDPGDQGAGRGTFPMPGIVTVVARDGRSATGNVDHVRGHPRNPMSFADVQAKFEACAALGRPGWTGTAFFDCVRSLEFMADVGSLVPICAAGASLPN